jgi:hypothetical protein
MYQAAAPAEIAMPVITPLMNPITSPPHLLGASDRVRRV